VFDISDIVALIEQAEAPVPAKGTQPERDTTSRRLHRILDALEDAARQRDSDVHVRRENCTSERVILAITRVQYIPRRSHRGQVDAATHAITRPADW
jgi:hypothetical protein